MATIADKLTRISALRSPAQRMTPVNSQPPRGAEEIAALLGASCGSNHYGEHLVVRNWYSSPEPGAALACANTREAALQLLIGRGGTGTPACPTSVKQRTDRSACPTNPENWLFLDTETTGLAGGTGTYAFLIGVAWWDAGGLQVEQFFLRDYADEHSVLLALAERLRERPVLVTYNGKTFDWPLLETRFRMTRAIAPPQPAAHLDLLHPARQLWRSRTGSARLADLEDLVLSALPGGLGWDRRCDVRGEMIPQIYFDYLRGGPPMPLVDVLRHNQMDLRGLAALASRMCALLGAPHDADADALELYGISRMLRRLALSKVEGRPQHLPQARACYERALAAGLPRGVARAARRELAALAKRERDYARATTLWNELIVGATLGSPSDNTGGASPAPTPDAEEWRSLQAAQFEEVSVGQPEGCPTDIEACEQLAIYYEHRERDSHRAMALTRAALAELRNALRTGWLDAARHAALRERLTRRLARLERKTAAALPLAENCPPDSAMRIPAPRRRI